jgi:hypothetical protein
MSLILINYLFCLCLAGFVILTLFSILAFCDLESFKIKKGNNTKSGIMLLVIGIVNIVFII